MFHLKVHPRRPCLLPQCSPLYTLIVCKVPFNVSLKSSFATRALSCPCKCRHHRLATFVVTFYSLAITTLVLILHFGVEKQIKDPTLGVRIGFLFGSLVSGAIFGVASVIFYRSVKLAIPAVAGFCKCRELAPDCSALGSTVWPAWC